MLVGSIQFVSTVVFSMVTSLAPMFSKDLGIPAQDVGTIAGSYMLAASISGFLGTLFLDRFDRRQGLAVAISGVVFGVVMSGFAPNRELLIASRVLTGVFSGPSAAFSLAIIIDNIPVERRGAALGSVISVQALGQIMGIPAGLFIATQFGSWRYPFFAIAVVGSGLALWVIFNLAPQRAHLDGATAGFSIGRRLRLMGALLVRPPCLVSWGLRLTSVVPLVAITTIMTVFAINNLRFPAEQLPLLYLTGGLANLLMSRLIGRAIDIFGSVPVVIAATVFLVFAIVFGYMIVGIGIPFFFIFPLFSVTSTARQVVTQTLSSRVPRPDERAGFQSLGQSIQSLAMAGSAMAIPYLLGSTPDGKLTGVVPFASGVIAVTCLYPFLVVRLVRLLSPRGRLAMAPVVREQPAE